MCRGLGSTNIVSSPTFVLINEYEGAVKIFHGRIYTDWNPPPNLKDWGFTIFRDRILLLSWNGPNLHYNNSRSIISFIANTLEKISGKSK